jgi:hypothetical protein
MVTQRTARAHCSIDREDVAPPNETSLRASNAKSEGSLPDTGTSKYMALATGQLTQLLRSTLARRSAERIHCGEYIF